MAKFKSKNLSIQMLFFIFILSFLSLTYSQKIETIKIGQVVKGKSIFDEGHNYYQLKIPRNESNRILIITTSEDSSINKNTKDSFSDPDFYISKINKYPSSKRSSEWFSEQYGSDILTIPAESVEEDDIFYIGVYCQFECKYFLKVETGLENEIYLKEYNFLRLREKETMNYKIKIKEDFETLKVMAISTFGGKFKFYMHQRLPSSVNTYKVIPSWENGYVIIIKKNSPEYCTNCEYHIIIHNEDDQSMGKVNDIVLYSVAENYEHEMNLEPSQKIYDALESNSKSCYSFNITEREKRSEKLIIDLVVYSGYATLLIDGWKRKYINKLDEIEKSDYVHVVNMEKYILLDKKDFDAFDQEQSFYSGRNSILHFCLFSERQTSYTIKAYYLSNLNDHTQNNILMQGNKLRGYLLKDQFIVFDLFDDNLTGLKSNIQSNISITVNKVVGDMSSYGYFCIEEKCDFTSKSSIEKLEYNKKLLIPKKELNPYVSFLNIPYNENYCLLNPVITLPNGNKINCNTFAIIKCTNPSEDSGLCIYDIQYTMKDSEITMKQNQVYKGIVYSSKIDKYKITISDPNVESLFVVLNSDTGDAQLSVFLEDETSYNKETLLSISSQSDYLPDVVRITPKIIGKDNLDKLKNSKVCIFGIGGVGSYVVEALARAGVGNFVLVDNDEVDITNINRQIIATTKTIGKAKVEIAKERIREINPNAKIDIFKEFFMPETIGILDNSIDYIVDAIDTVTAKIELVVRAEKMNIPIISSMGTGNKLDPTKFEIADIYKTSICPLAKVMRKELRNRGIDKLKVLYSKEEPIKTTQTDANKQVPGSISFVPSVAGLIIAGEVIKDIIK